MDATSNLEKVEGSNGKASTAESSPISMQPAKPNTGRTSKLIPEVALELLDAVLDKCQQAGIDISLNNYQNSSLIILENTKVEEGRIVPLNI